MLSRNYYFLFFFLLTVQSLDAQHSDINLLIDHALKIRGSNPDSSAILLRKAEKLSIEADYLKGEVISVFNAMRQNMAYAKLEDVGPRIFEIRKKVKGTELEKYAAEFDFVKGTISMQFSEMDSAVFLFKRCIGWYLDNDMKEATCSSYTNLSNIYIAQGNYALAKESMAKAYDAVQRGKKIMKYITLTALVRNSLAISDYENYSKFLIEGQKLADSFGMNSSDNVTEHSYANQIFNIKDDSLIVRLERSLPYLRKQVFKAPLQMACTTLGNVYQEQGKLEAAKELYLERLKYETDPFGKSIDYAYLLENRKLAGDDKGALKYLEMRTMAKDSVFQLRANENIEKLQVELQNVEKDYKINEQKKQRNVLFSALFLLSLFGGYIVYTLTKRNRLNEKIFEQKNLIDSQKIIQLKKENQLTRAQALLEGQEVERTRIANDLHDGLGGLLTTVKAHYSNIKNEVEALKSAKNSGRVENMIDEACGEVRRISHDLMPNVLRLDGLKTAIEEIALNLESIHNVNVDLEFANLEKRLDEKKETFIFRIFQELTNNIKKYSKAKNVVLQCHQFDHELVILVEDDGIGFDFESALQKEGLGLNSVLSRVDYLNGEIDINTEAGKGTSVTINIPLS